MVTTFPTGFSNDGDCGCPPVPRIEKFYDCSVCAPLFFGIPEEYSIANGFYNGAEKMWRATNQLAPSGCKQRRGDAVLPPLRIGTVPLKFL